jgi:catechol 2,3-dioxygenase-like lactoylglutathione lyase family enzyme
MRNGNIGNAHIAFKVDELEPIYQRLKAAGVRSVSEPVTPTIGPNKGGRAVYMIDPDGFRVELIQAPGSFEEYGRAQSAKAG